MQPLPPELFTVLLIEVLAGHGASGIRTGHSTREQPDCLALVQTHLGVPPSLAELGGGSALDVEASAVSSEAEASNSSWLHSEHSPRSLPTLGWNVSQESVPASTEYTVLAPTVLHKLSFGYYSDALVAFAVAVAAAWALGGRVPQYSKGILPQISGYLFMGIILGPYCTNLLSKGRLDLISGTINRICLSFIAGAAGVEIYLPELRSRLGAMALQVFLIGLATLVFCSSGLFFLSAGSVLAVPALDMQLTLAAKVSVILLVATLMTARSPASAIAVIAELGCGELQAARVCLGVTVCSDVVVLVIFAICMQFVRVVTQGSSFGPFVLLGVALQLVVSVLLGAVGSLLFRAIIPSSTESKEPAGGEPGGGGPEPQGAALAALRGALVIGILYGGTEVSARAAGWSHELLRLEPLLVCAAATCAGGHDEGRRARLAEALTWWTQAMVLPFFTLAGASLALPGLWAVLPAAVSLAVLRLLGIAFGSTAAGVLSSSLCPAARVSRTEICCTWLTLVSQAGVTLGLVLEVQEAFRDWGNEFATLVTSVVVLNQLIGPILCRLGLTLVIRAEEQRISSSSPDCLFETT